MPLLPPDSPTPHDGNDTEQDGPRLFTRRDHISAPIPQHERPSAFAKLTERLRRQRREAAPGALQRLPLRKISIALGVLVLIAFVGLCLLGAWLRHSMHAALPQIDGTLHVAGLSQPVTVTRNAQGVPSIQAGTLDDLLFAQGFVAAQDRLWQMDALRRHASGELAEILGSSLVEHDRTQRTLQIRAAADRAIAVLPPDQLHQLEAYARGVNAFLEQNSDRLPVEFHLLHYTPAPWQPRDSLLVSLAMFQDLSTEFPTKMRREALATHLPPELMADLYPVGSWRDHPPSQPSTDLTTPKPEIEQIPLDRSQSLLATPQDILRIAQQFPGQRCENCRAGSNNWAVAASRSASGGALLSNDMHLSLSVPDIWYEASLHGATLDVTGFTLPGVPFVLVGRNAHVAWSFTNLGADVQDIRVEHLRGSGQSTEFERADGTWSPVAHHSELIRVRRGRDIQLDVLTTTETVGNVELATPIISPLFPSEHRTLSLAWTIYDPANVSSPFLDIDAANDSGSLVASFASFGGPSLNLIYADDNKHIGYHAIGRIPVRGPAVHYPRAAPPAVPVGPTPPDEDDSEDAPQASLITPEDNPASHKSGPPSFAARCSEAPRAFAQRVGYRRQARHKHWHRALRRGYRAEARPLFSTWPASSTVMLDTAFHPVRRGQRVPPRTAKPQPKPKPKPKEATKPDEEPIIAAPVIDYTIGSPISPLPVDAKDTTQQWSGYIPYNELPAIIDPPNGFLATANARITPDDYPYAIALDWGAPYRVERINKLLAGRNGLTSADMLALQNDVHSEFDRVVAQRLVYALDHASQAALSHDTKRLHQTADILRSWNGEITPDSAAPSIINATRTQLWSMLLLPQIAAHDKAGKHKARPQELLALYQWGEQADALESLLAHTPARWLPPGFANWNDFLAEAVVRALHDAHAPSDVSSWHFGPLHPAEIDHPLFSMSPLFDRILGTATGSGPRATAGNATTIRAIGHHFGPSERFTADLASPDATTGNITTGESGNPASPWYLDQFEPWLKGTTLPLPLHDSQSTHTLTLLP
ncbi:penicillin acylase family protein [Granulicella sp. S156]|uniref:penicillin acylase family protein n=1 Tax=Granulicella sp. S156 TaxID=1747224 RepID=UPI0020B1315B|nr:penicillin acylase family protein [Granulicella sp. S156]